MTKLRWQRELLSTVLSGRIWTLFLVACLALPGCVIVPYKPGSEETISDDVQIPRGEVLLATVGPRELIKEVSEAITSTEDRIEIVDPIVFRDAAFPNGDWRLLRLLEKGTGQRVFLDLGVRYVVLIGEVEEATTDEKGGMALWIGFYGAASSKHEAKLTAIVIDLQNERPIYNISSTAKGSAVGVGLFYGVFVGPDSEASAIEGVGQKIGATISAAIPTGRIRIALMALEPMDEDYAASTLRQSLQRQLDEGDASYELKVELARLGDSDPLEMLAKKGDRQASTDLYQITGDSGPLHQLAKRGDPEAKAIIEAIEARKSREEKLAVAAETDRANAGSAEAQFQMYMRINTSDPLVWLCRAADGGQPYARYRLGVLYEHGIEGVEQNNVRAHMWYVRASESGHPWGDANANRIQSALTTDDVEESARLLLYSRPGQCEIDVVGKKEN